MTHVRLLVATLAVLLFSTMSRAQTALHVQPGWGHQRAGRWNLVRVRASRPTPQNVIIELISATDGGFENIIRENVAIGPTPGTFEVFAPLQYSRWTQFVVVLRDAQTQHVIAQYPQQLKLSAPPTAPLGPQDILVGSSGRKPPPGRLLRYAGAQSGFEPGWLLPRSAIGYDALDVLFLNQPDLRSLDADQQQAILHWVAGGGSLLLVPEDNPPPDKGPLISALPCRIATVRQFSVSANVLKASGLQSSFVRITGTTLVPSAGVRALELIPGSGINGFSRRFGLGRILVSPIDVASLEFEATDEAQNARAFWQRILERLVPITAPQGRQPFATPYNQYQSESEDQRREGAAVNALADFIAPPKVWHGLLVPNGTLMLLCILVVIGPIDWFVRRRTGRYTWAWVTAAGWVGLVALLAACGFALFDRAPPNSAIVAVIEQADHSVVASSFLMGFQSSANARLSVLPADESQPATWWEPTLPGTAEPATTEARPDFPFHENDRACDPAAFWIDARNTRFLHSRSIGPAPAMVETSLRLSGTSSDAAPHLIGTLKNVSTQNLKGIYLRTRFGVMTPTMSAGGVLAPGQTLQIDLPAKGEPFSPGSLEDRSQSYGIHGNRSYGGAVPEQELWAVAPDLDGRRSLRIDQMLADKDDVACIYAEITGGSALARLSDSGSSPAEFHQWLRAIVPLNQ